MLAQRPISLMKYRIFNSKRNNLYILAKRALIHGWSKSFHHKKGGNANIKWECINDFNKKIMIYTEYLSEN